MEITEIEPIFNGSNDDQLSELRTRASELEVTEETEERIDFRKLAEKEQMFFLKITMSWLRATRSAKCI